MLYHLFRYLDEAFDFPGAGMFQYLSFRAAAAIILSLLIVIIFGRKIIDFLRRRQIGEEIRNLGLEGQLQKRGTPTMGGVIILVAILVPTLLFGRLDNVYVLLLLFSTVWLGRLHQGFPSPQGGAQGPLQGGRTGRTGHHRRYDHVVFGRHRRA